VDIRMKLWIFYNGKATTMDKTFYTHTWRMNQNRISTICLDGRGGRDGEIIPQ